MHWRAAILILAFLHLHNHANAQKRVWLDNTGDFAVVAELVQIQDERVQLRRASDGLLIWVPLERLSKKDCVFAMRELLWGPRPAPNNPPQRLADHVGTEKHRPLSSLAMTSPKSRLRPPIDVSQRLPKSELVGDSGPTEPLVSSNTAVGFLAKSATANGNKPAAESIAPLAVANTERPVMVLPDSATGKMPSIETLAETTPDQIIDKFTVSARIDWSPSYSLEKDLEPGPRNLELVLNIAGDFVSHVSKVGFLQIQRFDDQWGGPLRQLRIGPRQPDFYQGWIRAGESVTSNSHGTGLLSLPVSIRRPAYLAERVFRLKGSIKVFVDAAREDILVPLVLERPTQNHPKLMSYGLRLGASKPDNQTVVIQCHGEIVNLINVDIVDHKGMPIDQVISKTHSFNARTIYYQIAFDEGVPAEIAALVTVVTGGREFELPFDIVDLPPPTQTAPTSTASQNYFNERK